MVFVTGGTGLIGSHLLVELVQKHDHITAIYNDPKKIETVRSVMNYYLGNESSTLFDKITWKQCNILNVPLLEEVMSGHSIVYHCAATVSFKRRDFSKMIKVNRYGTANVVNICLEQKVDKLCYVSSTAAVGNKDIPSDEFVDENGKWILTDDTSGYSISKYSAEKEVWRGISLDLKAVGSLRYTSCPLLFNERISIVYFLLASDAVDLPYPVIDFNIIETLHRSRISIE